MFDLKFASRGQSRSAPLIQSLPTNHKKDTYLSLCDIQPYIRVSENSDSLMMDLHISYMEYVLQN